MAESLGLQGDLHVRAEGSPCHGYEACFVQTDCPCRTCPYVSSCPSSLDCYTQASCRKLSHALDWCCNALCCHRPLVATLPHREGHGSPSSRQLSAYAFSLSIYLCNSILLQSFLPPLAGQLEAALALAHQRIAELEAQVESLEATVHSLKEALAATIGHAGRLKVTTVPPT